MTSSELYHHGIKGMKWGIRRTDAQLGHDSQKQRSNGSSSKRAKRQSDVTSRGKDKAVQLLKRYGPMLLKAGAITAASAIGGTYVAMFASATISQLMDADISLPGIESHTISDHSDARITFEQIKKER